MEVTNAKAVVVEKIRALIESDADDRAFDDRAPLIGEDSLLDSMKLVELCLALEDHASDLGFTFDWTSETAMSRFRGMFRSIGALAEEFARQSGS